MTIRIHKRCRNCSSWYKVPVNSRRHMSFYCSLSCTTTYRNKTQNPTSSPEVREKIKESAKLRDNSHLRTRESIDKQRKTISGERHWNWQGGKTKESARLRNSWEYKKWRSSVYKRDNYTCVLCKKRGCYLNADHIKPWAHYPELRFDIANGRTLCTNCHYKTDTFGFKSMLHTQQDSYAIVWYT